MTILKLRIGKEKKSGEEDKYDDNGEGKMDVISDLVKDKKHLVMEMEKTVQMNILSNIEDYQALKEENKAKYNLLVDRLKKVSELRAKQALKAKEHETIRLMITPTSISADLTDDEWRLWKSNGKLSK